jgi:hypothetical protein
MTAVSTTPTVSAPIRQEVSAGARSCGCALLDHPSRARQRREGRRWVESGVSHRVTCLQSSGRDPSMVEVARRLRFGSRTGRAPTVRTYGFEEGVA